MQKALLSKAAATLADPNATHMSKSIARSLLYNAGFSYVQIQAMELGQIAEQPDYRLLA